MGWLERCRCRSGLTFRTRHVLSQFVQLLRKCLAVWTVALWLLATQHCGLESVGVLAQSCEQPGGQHDCSTGTHFDGCQVVEGAAYKSSNNSITVAAPALVSDLHLLALCLVNPVSPELVVKPSWQYADRPRAWVPNWSFVQRTALSPRAPSLA